jgi:hypothetical protein
MANVAQRIAAVNLASLDLLSRRLSIANTDFMILYRFFEFPALFRNFDAKAWV